jgi:hypothetical protein
MTRSGDQTRQQGPVFYFLISSAILIRNSYHNLIGLPAISVGLKHVPFRFTWVLPAGRYCSCLAGFFLSLSLQAQQKDSVVEVEGKLVTLTEVVIRNGTDVPGFVRRVMQDTSFYKAFRNLRILNYSSLNDIRMLDKKGVAKATYNSRVRQHAWMGCRVTEILEQQHSGDFFNRKGGYNYYTAELYDALFFSMDTVCGEDNLVRDIRHEIRGKSGLAKHKEQLKMLFFNPGADIPGIPLMGDKVKVFDPENAELYDFDIDIRERGGKPCYVFMSKARGDLSGSQRDRVVIDEMVTWFDYVSFEVLARQYTMSYQAGLYSFNVQMEVDMTHAAGFLVPAVIRYIGYWGVAFRKRERGVFTATLFDFSK